MSDTFFMPAWYVIHTRSRFENVVNEGLQKKNIESFLPRIMVKSKRRDRLKMIKVPLFPGYVFVRTTLKPDNQLDVVKTVGVVNFICAKQRPLQVPDESIASLRIMVEGDQDVLTGTGYQKGEKIVVLQGPFTGVRGVFARYRGKGRVIIHIEALGQFAAVEVDEDVIQRTILLER